MSSDLLGANSSNNSSSHNNDSNESSSLSGMFNLNKLEQLLSQLQSKISQQSKQITELQKGPTQAEFQQLQQTVSHVQHSVKGIEQRLSALEDIGHVVNEHASVIESLQSSLQHTATRADLRDSSDSLLATLDQSFQQLHKDKASKVSVTSLDHSNKAVIDEVRTLQSVLAHKIDRSELPLLEAAEEKLQELLNFEAAASNRLSTLEQQQRESQHAINGKESKEAIVARMQAIHQHLKRKVETKQFEALQQQLQSVLSLTDQLNSLPQQHMTLAEQMDKLSDHHSSSSSKHATMQEVLESIGSQLQKKIDASSLDRLKSETSKQLAQAEQKSQHELKVQSAYVADLRQQVQELQEVNVSIEHRLSVALKFVDWFTEARLQR